MTRDKVQLEVTNIEPNSDSKLIQPRIVKKCDITFLEFFNSQLSFGHAEHSSAPISEPEITTTIKENETENKNQYIISNINLANIANANLQKLNDSQINDDNKFIDNLLTINAKNLTSEDIKQLNSLIDTPGYFSNINQTNGLINFSMQYNEASISYTSNNFSKNLSNMLSKAYKNNKPVRIDFENNSSVILKIDREGKLSAQFITSDKAMEMLLKENLQHLKNKFDEEGLPYKELTYKDNSDQKDQRESKKDR